MTRCANELLMSRWFPESIACSSGAKRRRSRKTMELLTLCAMGVSRVKVTLPVKSACGMEAGPYTVVNAESEIAVVKLDTYSVALTSAYAISTLYMLRVEYLWTPIVRVVKLTRLSPTRAVRKASSNMSGVYIA